MKYIPFDKSVHQFLTKYIKSAYQSASAASHQNKEPTCILRRCYKAFEIVNIKLCWGKMIIVFNSVPTVHQQKSVGPLFKRGGEEIHLVSCHLSSLCIYSDGQCLIQFRLKYQKQIRRSARIAVDVHSYQGGADYKINSS